MAVVQISKIQVRRGQKNSNSGIPQLSSAEFAWAVDSQELFIGNGSVAEGAPYVGNTKILTEHDNILALASSYQFASNDTSITLSVPRSLQTKLDEYVSVADFGAIGDGSTDCVAAFETAFTQLFRNVDTNYKKVLYVPNGEYLFLSDLSIPSDVILRGETKLNAVLNIGDNNILFLTRDGKSIINFDSSNRPENIEVSNLTIRRTTGQITLSGVADSEFKNVMFLGEYDIHSDTVTSLTTEPAAVLWNNEFGKEGIIVDNVKFTGCEFISNSISIKCVQTVVYDSRIKFNDCKFFNNHVGIYIDGLALQGNKWLINGCEFEEIYSNAFRSTNGQGTIIQESRFVKCGNGTNAPATPLEPIVYFGEKIGNTLVDCTSDRQQSAGVTASGLKSAVTEVYNGDATNFIDRNYSAIYAGDNFQTLAVFSASNRYIVVKYFLSLDVFSRFGTLTIIVGDGQQEVTLTDDYTYSSPLASSNGGQLMTNFEFGVELKDNDTDSGIDTVVLSYKNPLPGPTGPSSISFDVAYGV